MYPLSFLFCNIPPRTRRLWIGLRFLFLYCRCSYFCPVTHRLQSISNLTTCASTKFHAFFSDSDCDAPHDPAQPHNPMPMHITDHEPDPEAINANVPHEMPPTVN